MRQRTATKAFFLPSNIIVKVNILKLETQFFFNRKPSSPEKTRWRHARFSQTMQSRPLFENERESPPRPDWSRKGDCRLFRRPPEILIFIILFLIFMVRQLYHSYSCGETRTQLYWDLWYISPDEIWYFVPGVPLSNITGPLWIRLKSTTVLCFQNKFCFEKLLTRPPDTGPPSASS